MNTRSRFIRGLVMSLLAGLLVASAGRAALGRSGLFGALASGKVTLEAESGTPDDEGTAQDCSTSDEGTSDEGTSDEGTSDEGTSDEGTSDEGTSDEGTSDECEASDDEGTAEDPPPPASGDREAECTEAAGITAADQGDSGDGTDGSEGKTTGLDHAIEVVMANCIKNPQAPGLLNALRHLVENRDRHMAHDADKADRRAARDAAKAARKAEHGKGPKD